MKPIRFSQHALFRMNTRGATIAEVTAAVQTGAREPAQRGKLQARKSFPFGQPSPANQQVYAFKTVHVVFADEPTETVVVTVMVYYGN